MDIKNMTRRGRPSTFGQKGGQGPNAGKKAATFQTLQEFGNPPKLLRKRVFDLHASMIGRTEGVAAILPAKNGYPYSIWTVAASEADMPDYVKAAILNFGDVIFCPCVRV